MSDAIKIPFSTDDLLGDLKNALEDAPLKLAKAIYFAGGTMCIDTSEVLVMLNLNGQMSYNLMSPNVGSVSIQQPKELLEMVRKTYVRVKGETPYYKEEVLGISKDKAS